VPRPCLFQDMRPTKDIAPTKRNHAVNTTCCVGAGGVLFTSLSIYLKGFSGGGHLVSPPHPAHNQHAEQRQGSRSETEFRFVVEDVRGEDAVECICQLTVVFQAGKFILRRSKRRTEAEESKLMILCFLEQSLFRRRRQSQRSNFFSLSKMFEEKIECFS
jgi:hypothetical protein